MQLPERKRGRPHWRSDAPGARPRDVSHRCGHGWPELVAMPGARRSVQAHVGRGCPVAPCLERRPQKIQLLLGRRHGLEAPVAQHPHDGAPLEGQSRSGALCVDVGVQLSNCRGPRRRRSEIRQGAAGTRATVGSACPQGGHRAPRTPATTRDNWLKPCLWPGLLVPSTRYCREGGIHARS